MDSGTGTNTLSHAVNWEFWVRGGGRREGNRLPGEGAQWAITKPDLSNYRLTYEKSKYLHCLSHCYFGFILLSDKPNHVDTSKNK